MSSWNDKSSSLTKGQSSVKRGCNKRKGKDDGYDFYEELSKRFVNQQDQTSKHRSSLIRWFAALTLLQLVFIDAIIIIAMFYKSNIISELLDFMKYFVSATFVELLGGLFIIVKFAFSHETYDMLKHLTYIGPKLEQQSTADS